MNVSYLCSYMYMCVNRYYIYICIYHVQHVTFHTSDNQGCIQDDSSHLWKKENKLASMTFSVLQ